MSTRTEPKQSIGELVSLVSEKTSQLVRDEIRLAKAEMAEKAKHAGAGIGLFAGAGVLAFWAVAVLIAAAVLGLANAVPAWLAAIIVAVAILAVAAVLVLIGVQLLKKGTPPTPEKAIESAKADVAAVKEGLGA